MKLSCAKKGREYKIIKIKTNDEEQNLFLLKIGFYDGEKIMVKNVSKNNLVINVKGSNYNIDRELAGCIDVAESDF